MEGTPLSAIQLTDIGIFPFFGYVDDESAAATIDFLLKWSYFTDGSVDPTIIFNSGGGCVLNGLAIYDVMQSCSFDIRTVSTGMSASMASLLVAAGTKGKRYITRNSMMMTHQMSAFNKRNHVSVDGREPFEQNPVRKAGQDLCETYQLVGHRSKAHSAARWKGQVAHG